jgi:hypothetical protein
MVGGCRRGVVVLAAAILAAVNCGGIPTAGDAGTRTAGGVGSSVWDGGVTEPATSPGTGSTLRGATEALEEEGTAAFEGGCYVDCVESPSCTDRLLVHTVTVKWENMSVGLCKSECARLGYRLAGVEAGYGCFCGNSNASKVVAAPESECCGVCSGNESEFCGERFRIWWVHVYALTEPASLTCLPSLHLVSTRPSDLFWTVA